MKPTSFNRDMRKELSCTLAAYGIMAAAADVATVSAWDYVTGWICSITADLSALLRLYDTAVPSPEPSAILNPPLTTIADAAADCRLGTLIAAVVAVTVGILALGFASWACAWARLHVFVSSSGFQLRQRFFSHVARKGFRFGKGVPLSLFGFAS